MVPGLTGEPWIREGEGRHTLVQPERDPRCYINRCPQGKNKPILNNNIHLCQHVVAVARRDRNTNISPPSQVRQRGVHSASSLRQEKISNLNSEEALNHKQLIEVTMTQEEPEHVAKHRKLAEGMDEDAQEEVIGDGIDDTTMASSSEDEGDTEVEDHDEQEDENVDSTGARNDGTGPRDSVGEQNEGTGAESETDEQNDGAEDENTTVEQNVGTGGGNTTDVRPPNQPATVTLAVGTPAARKKLKSLQVQQEDINSPAGIKPKPRDPATTDALKRKLRYNDAVKGKQPEEEKTMYPGKINVWAPAGVAKQWLWNRVQQKLKKNFSLYQIEEKKTIGVYQKEQREAITNRFVIRLPEENIRQFKSTMDYFHGGTRDTFILEVDRLGCDYIVEGFVPTDLKVELSTLRIETDLAKIGIPKPLALQYWKVDDFLFKIRLHYKVKSVAEYAADITKNRVVWPGSTSRPFHLMKRTKNGTTQASASQPNKQK